MMAYIALIHRGFNIKSSFFIYTVLTLGIIQAGLAGIGYILGQEILVWIQHWDHWVVFLFFSYLAWKQWTFDPKSEMSFKKLSYGNIVLLGVMCSVDALIVTIPLVDLFWDIKSYFISTFLFTIILALIAPMALHSFKNSKFYLSSKFAAILIFILGTKILVEHLRT